MPQLESILKAFGQSTRLRILRLVSRQELAVNELVEALGLPQSRISRHLAVLRHAGLVQDRREGNWVYYRLDADQLDPLARRIWEALRSSQPDAALFPDDLDRLKDTLAKRQVRSQAYFDAVLTEWDRIRRNYIDEALSSSVLSSLVRPDALAVDVGTGTGELLVALAETAGKVIGVDRSQKMLELCKRRLERSGVRNVELRRGEADDLPVADAECDAALSSMLLHHLSDPAAGVREMARVVRPGGKVVVSDLVKHDYDWTREIMADVWLGFDQQQIHHWFTAAGLTDVEYSSTAVSSPLEPDSRPKLGAFIATGIKPPRRLDRTEGPLPQRASREPGPASANGKSDRLDRKRRTAPDQQDPKSAKRVENRRSESKSWLRQEPTT